MLGDFYYKIIEKGNMYSNKNKLSREICCAEDYHSYVITMCAKKDLRVM